MPSKEEGRGREKKRKQKASFEKRDFFWEQLTEETLVREGGQWQQYIICYK